MRIGVVAAVWGVLGLVIVLVEAVVRLAPIAAEALQGPLTVPQLVIGAAWTAGMAYAEGWRGFHLRFAPRAVHRAIALSRAPRPVWALLAPLFVSGLIGATPRRLRATWLLTAGIVAAVVVIRALPQPWRGLLDQGVVVGLTIGVLSTCWHAARAVAGITPTIDPDLPR